MKLVTVATHSERYYPYLLLSAKQNGHELISLGWGEKWKGFGWRFNLMKEYLESLKTDEVVCFIDAFDVIVLEDPDTIEKKFNNMIKGDKTKIVASIEVQSDNEIGNIFVNSWSSFFSYKCNRHYMNAGTYIGYSSAIIHLFNDLCKEFECKSDADDQILLQKYCVNHSDIFLTDTNSNIFLVMSNVIDVVSNNKNFIDIKNNKLKYKEVYPSIFHSPAYSDIDDILDSLGYDPTLFRARNENKWNYRFGFIKHFIKELFLRYFIIIIGFIIVCFLIFYLHYTKTINEIKKNIRQLYKRLKKNKL